MDYSRPKKTSRLTPVIIAIIFVAGFAAYISMNGNSARAQTDPVLISSESEAGDSPFTAQDLATLAKIESIKLDGSFFKNPVFVSLRDWTVELGHEDAGRNNPFAPVGGAEAQ